MRILLSKPTGGEILGAAGVALFAALLVLDHLRMPEAERMADSLEKELAAIAPPPGSRMIGGIDRMVKASGVVVSKRYALSLAGPADTHLRQQLQDHGWSLCSAKSSEFCKDQFQAALDVQDTASQVEVAVVLSWH